jgi:hypothetical protein
VNCVTFSEDLLGINELLICPAFWLRDKNIYVTLFVFNCTPTFLLASTKSVYAYDIYVFDQHISIVSVNHDLMCSIQLQASLIIFDPPGGMF